MSLKGDILLGLIGNEFKISAVGRKLTIDTIETAREKRAADGTLKKDILFVKKSFILDYSLINGDDLTVLESIYNYKQPLSLKIFKSNTLSDDYIVSMIPSKKTRMILLDHGIWSGVSFKLDEI